MYEVVVVVHEFGVACQIFLVGVDIERILTLGHFPERLDVIRIADSHAVRALGIGIHQFAAPEFGLGKHLVLTVRLALALGHIGHTHIHQIDGIVHIWTMLALGITSLELAEGLDGKREVLEFLIDDDALVVKTFLDEFVGSLFLVIGERNLCQVIFRLVRIVGILVVGSCTFFGRRNFSGRLGGKAVGCYSFGKLVGGISIVGVLLVVEERRFGLVLSTPVVLGFAGTPGALERGLSLGNLCGVVEVPRLVLFAHRGLFVIGCQRVGIRRLVGLIFCQAFLVLGFLFGLDEVLDDLCDDLVELVLGQFGKFEQTVLQLDSLGVGLQFVEHGAQTLYLLVALELLVDDAHCRAVGFLRLDVVFLNEGDFAQSKGGNGLVDAVARALFHSCFELRDGLCGILLEQSHVAESVVDLVEVLFVAELMAHAVELLFDLGEVLGRSAAHLRKYVGLCQLGVELSLVVVAAVAQSSEDLVCLGVVAAFFEQLGKEVVTTQFLGFRMGGSTSNT